MLQLYLIKYNNIIMLQLFLIKYNAVIMLQLFLIKYNNAIMLQLYQGANLSILRSFFLDESILRNFNHKRHRVNIFFHASILKPTLFKSQQIKTFFKLT